MKYYSFDGFCSVVGMITSYFFGGLDGLMHALFVLIAIDYVTGVFAAGIKRELSSSIGYKGIKRKVTILLLVGMAHVIDRELLGNTVLIRDGVICFYLANEGLSILENAIVIGVPAPEKLKELLLQFHDKGKDNNEKSGVKA